ncbi:hypothetical protein E2C01_011793 [Portunus trituberculatus]|uniref:Uncharacterized protein n=1 Tax=Portunus trituberculatus TaxID=210409 RepID=A0A5B7DCT2_PORTR|nr:hypothetical protein [Portunus trituberculatus]
MFGVGTLHEVTQRYNSMTGALHYQPPKECDGLVTLHYTYEWAGSEWVILVSTIITFNRLKREIKRATIAHSPGNRPLTTYCLGNYKKGNMANYDFGTYAWDNDAFEMD